VTTPLTAEPTAALGPGVAAARAAASPAWLAARRRIAWDAYEALPMPSSHSDEDWRRTDISGLHVERFTPLESVDAAVLDAMRAQRDSAAPDAALIFDGPITPIVEGADTLLAQGIIVTTLEEAATVHPELVQRVLAAVRVDETKFIALWNALWRGGAFVYVPRGVEALVPVWIAHAASGSDVAVFPTTAVLLDEGASLTVIDAYASPAGTDAVLSDAMVVLSAGRDARLDYCTVQEWGAGVWHIAMQRTSLDANAKLRFTGVTLGARLQKAWWEVLLNGIGSEADIFGICFGDGTQHIDHQSLQAHVGAETRSNLLLKVAVRDQARSVYGGMIDVAPTAVHADGYVANRNLLLSQGAKADSIPRLEIRANDVKCGHGATAGHIDSEQRFYLMARGIPPDEASSLIVRGFMDDVLDRVPHRGFAELAGTLLDAEIAGASVAGLAAAEA
jgi:Fe-S cluster assembly protein SufD